MRQQVYTQLVQAFEQARIEEVRDTPTLTIIEEPYVPVRPEPTGIVSKTIISLLVGLALGSFLAFIAQIVEGLRRSEPAGFTEARERLLVLRSDLLRPWRLLKRSS
jgi:uncharacterized protein involved in exopolysaccharide biosynthesis